MKRLPKLSGLMCTMMLALGALAFMTVTPTATLAQTCGGSYTPSFVTTGPYFSGDTVTLKITLTSSVSGTTDGTEDVNEIDFITDCSNENGAYYDGTASTCDGAGADDPVSFDSVVSTTCKDSLNATVSWSEASNTPPTSGGIRFTPGNPVHFTGDAQSCEIVFNMTVNSTADPANNPVTQSGRWIGTCSNSPNNLSGGAQGSDAFSVESCSVTIDKQVSCDGGTTWYDQTGVDDTNGDQALDGVNCVGINEYTDDSGTTPATDIKVRYKVHNTGSVALENCGATESNGLILGGTTGTVDITAVQTGFDPDGMQTTDPATKACSTALANDEADTAMINCHCVGADSSHNASASDSADFSCVSPQLGVVKSCSTQSNDANDFTIDVSNPGDVDLTNCTITDKYLENSDCPTTVFGDGSEIEVASFTPADNGGFGVTAGGGPVSHTGTINSLLANACNEASVTCYVGDTTETITASDQDTCEVGQGCDTRTPGFWGTHPTITQQVITDSGGTVQSCGLGILYTDYDAICSATQDICSVGKDSNTLGYAPQDMQLIRQCMAAELNFAASAQDGGSCDNTLPGIASTLEDCCGTDSVCSNGQSAGGGPTVAACISALDAFNNLETTIEGSQYLTSPGPADSSQCRAASGDGVVNNPADCDGDRTYATKSTGGGLSPTNNTNNGQHKGQNK